jgi:hypothetical protein
LYKDATGFWRKRAGTSFPFAFSGNVPTYWTRTGIETTVAEDQYFVYWLVVYGSADGTNMFLISHPATYSSTANAQSGATFSDLTSILGSLPSTEMLVAYRLIFQYNAAAAGASPTSVKSSKLRMVDDFRNVPGGVIMAGVGSGSGSYVLTVDKIAAAGGATNGQPVTLAQLPAEVLTNASAFATAAQGIAATNAQARVSVLETNAVLKNDARYLAALTNAWQNPVSATNWTWTKTATEVTLTGYTGPNAVVIPDMLDGLPVTGFGTIFQASAVITNVSGGENITAIDHYAFSGCSALKYVSLPNATTIGEAALSSCFALASVSLPNVTTIGFSAFYDCTNLTSASLPSVMTIEGSALSYCSALTSLSLPNATTIGNSALRECTSLTYVYFAQNAPAQDLDVYTESPNVTNYVTSPTATGWGTTWGGRPVVRMSVYSDSFVGNGSGLTNITAAQVGAVATNDAKYLAALTNGGASINGSPITNGASFTITGGGSGGGISNISVAGIAGTLTGSGSNVLSSVSLASLAGAGVATNYAATPFDAAETIVNTSALTVTSYFGHAYSRTFTSTGTITHLFLGTNATGGNEVFMEMTATGLPARVWPAGYTFGYGGSISSNAPSPTPWAQMSVQKTPMGAIIWAVTGQVWQAGTP